MATDLTIESAFDPGAHRSLRDLGERLRDLAGDAAYKAGRDYQRKGLVRNGTVAGTTAYATVSGSTDYRVSLSFGDEPKATCTCPAHRRNKFCKHVVALCVALIERPSEFIPTEPAPEAPKAPRLKRDRLAVSIQAPLTVESRGAGLETVASLLDALAADGLVGLGADKRALLESAGELVRARKLRRLGNRILALQRAAEGGKGGELDPAAFARLVVDLDLTYRATLAHLEGRAQLDPAEAEDLLGKTWREADLELVAGLELVELASETASDAEFRVETGYLVELSSGELFLERQINPARFAALPRTRQRCRLMVDEARLYPGPAPRRIRLGRTRRAPLTRENVDRIVATASDEMSEIRHRLDEHLANPFAGPTVPVLFRPAAIVGGTGRLGALDRAGRFVALEWPEDWTDEVPPLLPPDAPVALLGDLGLTAAGPSLRGRALIGALVWERGPIYPDAEKGR